MEYFASLFLIVSQSIMYIQFIVQIFKCNFKQKLKPTLPWRGVFFSGCCW